MTTIGGAKKKFRFDPADEGYTDFEQLEPKLYILKTSGKDPTEIIRQIK